MAPFNPDVAVKQDPNYLGLSQPISNIPNHLVATKGDTSLGEMFKGFGDVLSLATKGVDSIIKNDIDNKLFAQAGTERDQYTQALEKTVGTGLSANGAGEESTTVAQSVPGDIQDGLDNVARLKSAKQAKVFPETYYLQRLNTVVKDMRAQYPGYREYIDKSVAQITGVNPANAYLSSLQQQLKSAQSGKDLDQSKAITLLQQNLGVPGAKEMIAGVLNGTHTYYDAVKLISPAKQLEFQREQNKAELEDVKLPIEARRLKANDQIDNEAPQLVANIISGIQSQAGGVVNSPNGPVKTSNLEEIGAAIIQSQTGQGPRLSAEDATKLGVAYDAKLLQLRQQTWGDWVRTGKVRALGTKEAEAKLDQVFKPLDDIVKMIKDNQLGPAFFAANMSKAAVDQSTNNLYNDKDNGETFRMMSSLRDIQGPGKAYLDSIVTNIMAAKDPRTGASLSTGIQSMMSNKMLRMSTQPAASQGGPVYTMNDAITDALRKGVKTPQVYSTYLDSAKKITEKNVPDEVKYNLAKAISDPANIGVLSKFTMDGHDQSGNYVQGRYVAFGKLVNEDVAKEVKRLSQNDPKLWDDYSSFVRHSFTNELFGSDLRSLQNFDSKSVKLAWDSDNKKLIATKEKLPGDFYKASEARRLAQDKAVATVNRINMGLKSVEGYAKASGAGDVESMMIRSMMDAGFDPRNLAGLPRNIFNLLMNQKMKDIPQSK